MNEHEKGHALAAEDGGLVDEVTAVLVDPTLHTDLRMRLAREITELLRTAHEALYGPAGREVHQQALAAHGEHVPSLLAAVLVDPNLHTDLRMRLHREIPVMLRGARERATARAGRQN
jgi:hypothetical protein